MISRFKKPLLITILILLAAFSYGVKYFSDVIINPERITLADYKPIHPDEKMSPAELGLKYSDEIIKYKNNNCYGWYIPAAVVTDNLVILVHGRGDNKRKCLKFAPFIHNAGYNVFLMDNRNSGNSYSAPCSFGYYESQELLAAYLQLKSKFNIKKVAFIGYSMGAATAVLAAARTSDLYSMILDSPYISFNDVIRVSAHKDYAFLPDFFTNLVMSYTGFRLGFDTREVDLEKYLKKSQVPLLIIHSGKDDKMPASYGRKLYGASAAKDKSIWFVPDAGHVRAYLVEPQLYKQKVLARLKSASQIVR